MRWNGLRSDRLNKIAVTRPRAPREASHQQAWRRKWRAPLFCTVLHRAGCHQQIRFFKIRIFQPRLLNRD